MRSLVVPILIGFVTLCAEDGARYLVITHDNFYAAIQPLAQWKVQKGIPTKVVRLSEIGSNPADIRNYVLNAYNNWPIRPEYLLLVGSPAYLPPWSTLTDDGYADMQGNYEIELSIGRFFCNTASECSTLVAKTLVYERTPFLTGDSTWMLRGTTIVREDNPPDPYYQADSRFARDLWRAAGFLQTESLLNTAGHNSTNVRSAINNGRGFVTYRGQCLSNWWQPFDQVQPATLTNGSELPIVVTGSCQTVILSPGQSMLSDQFVRAGTPSTLRGAVAYFGTTYVGSHISLQRGTVYRGFFNALFAEGRYRLGDACKRGKFYIDSLMPGNQTYYQEWNLLGDPELPVWTSKPKIIAAAYDSLVPLGSSDFPVMVTCLGTPVESALVCVMMDSTVYATGITDNSGRVTLRIAPVHLGSLTVTVTARSAVPFVGSASVIATNGPYMVFSRAFIDDLQGGNNNHQVNPGEIIRLSVLLTNGGDSLGRAIRARLFASDTFARVTETLATFGDIPAHDSAFSATPYVFSVSPACTCGQVIPFRLQIQDAIGRHWLSNFGLPVSAARIRYNSNLVNDPPPGGNGNGRINGRESALLLVNLRNTGTDTLSAVRAVLRTNSGYINITDSIGSFGNIPPGSGSTNSNDPFALISSPNLPGVPISFTLLIQGDGSTYPYLRAEQFTITPVGTPGPIGPDPYGYYCYDDTDTLSGRAPVFSWLELAPPGPGQLIPGITEADAGLDTLRLPFRFKFYGRNFDTITVASNGFACFGASGNRGANNSRIPSPDSAAYRNLLPMWDDLNPGSTGHGDCYEYYDAANHRWIVEFYQVPHYWSQNTQETFQYILLDPAYYPTPTGDGEILFLYHTVADPDYSTIGIQDYTWTRAIQYVCNGSYDPDAAPLAAGRVLRFTTQPPAPALREWLTLSRIVCDDSLQGNNNHAPEPGEVISLIITLRNRGDSMASAASGILRRMDQNSIILDSATFFGDIPGQGEGDNRTQPCRFQVPMQPADSQMRFALLLRTGPNSTIIYFTIPIGVSTAIHGEPMAVPSRLWLSCLPNPACNAVTINFGVPQTDVVHLSICDVTGRVVRTLLKECLTPGSYSIAWDRRNDRQQLLPAGNYFLRLNTGNRPALIRRLVVAR